MQIDRARVAVAALCVSLAAGGWSALGTWNALHAEVRDGAAQVLAFVDTRLHDIDSEMSVLLAHPSLNVPSLTCDAALTTQLARASTSSVVVQSFVLTSDEQMIACHPFGTGAALYLPIQPRTRLSLTSTGEIRARVTATQRLGTSPHVLAAVLDPRAFEPGAFDMLPWASSPTVRYALLSVDGRRLATLGEHAAQGDIVASLRAVATSATRDVMVSAEIERPTFETMLWRRVLLAVLGALVVLAGIVGASWRVALLRSRAYHRIARGLRKREFVPFVQPIVELATGRCAGAEVLIRWNHPYRGILPPAEFIEEAERTGLIISMSDLVMTRASHQLSAIAEAHPELYFSFNITPQQLTMPQLSARLDEIFRADSLPRAQVLLELTERDFVETAAVRQLNALQDSGWRVAIDDFGTGHSSLASLEQLQVDRLKIDRAFVRTIGEETASRPVLDAIIGMAGQLDVAMIAEGVETQTQWDYLASRGVQYAQGYLIARPMSIDAFAAWLASSNPSTATVSTSAAPSTPSVRAAATQSQDAFARHVWNLMRTPGGLDVRDRMFHLRTYDACFVGREAVDWLVQHQRLSRSEAVRLGQHLVALGLISHVVSEHDFEDAELFYRLTSPAAASLAARPVVADLLGAMHGAGGVPLGDQVRGFIRHGDAITGTAVVDWFVSTYRVDRSAAVLWASTLMRQGALRHVYDDRPFSDDQTLYRRG
jgi:EAL domain-containing protein (putative c-di-GMP-specific phosphodiesterase class I)